MTNIIDVISDIEWELVGLNYHQPKFRDQIADLLEIIITLYEVKSNDKFKPMLERILVQLKKEDIKMAFIKSLHSEMLEIEEDFCLTCEECGKSIKSNESYESKFV